MISNFKTGNVEFFSHPSVAIGHSSSCQTPGTRTMSSIVYQKTRWIKIFGNLIKCIIDTEFYK